MVIGWCSHLALQLLEIATHLVNGKIESADRVGMLVHCLRGCQNPYTVVLRLRHELASSLLDAGAGGRRRFLTAR